MKPFIQRPKWKKRQQFGGGTFSATEKEAVKKQEKTKEATNDRKI